MRLLLILVLLVFTSTSAAGEFDDAAVEREVTDFFTEYLQSYNRYFADPENDPELRVITEHFQMPLMQAPPVGQPFVPESREQFAAGLKGFINNLSDKGVESLQYKEVQIHILTPTKVVASNIGHGIGQDGDVVYETVSLYLLHRSKVGWKIALISPYAIERALNLD